MVIDLFWTCMCLAAHLHLHLPFSYVPRVSCVSCVPVPVPFFFWPAKICRYIGGQKKRGEEKVR